MTMSQTLPQNQTLPMIPILPWTIKKINLTRHRLELSEARLLQA
jgi:hypothetical protein